MPRRHRRAARRAANPRCSRLVRLRMGSSPACEMEHKQNAGINKRRLTGRDSRDEVTEGTDRITCLRQRNVIYSRGDREADGFRGSRIVQSGRKIMRKTALVITLFAAAAAFTWANAATVAYKATLGGAAEVPPVQTAGKCYINVHTAANKGGEIRGQLAP